MRLCSYGKAEEVAILKDGGLLPIKELNKQVGRHFPTTMLEFIECGVVEYVKEVLSENEWLKPTLKVEDVQMAPPYRFPPKVWGIGLNYRRHIEDLNEKPPEEPASFMKPSTTIIGQDDEIILPEQSKYVTAEAELAVIIGRECKNITEAEAPHYIFGYTTVLDMTAVDILQRNPRFLTRAKSFDTFFSFGPWVVTRDEIKDESLGEVRITTRNGDEEVTNVISDMIFSPFYLVSFHSKVMTLKPGDIISTGTPGALTIKAGDRVEAIVEGIGSLSNPVVAPK
ncbi:MAG: fumarylacetoacetate hydrolase family protein [Dethiobacteria bacterium]